MTDDSVSVNSAIHRTVLTSRPRHSRRASRHRVTICHRTARIVYVPVAAFLRCVTRLAGDGARDSARDRYTARNRDAASASRRSPGSAGGHVISLAACGAKQRNLHSPSFPRLRPRHGAAPRIPALLLLRSPPPRHSDRRTNYLLSLG